MDKSWMKITNRRSQEYLDEVQQFLNFASNHAYPDGTISCPCKKCMHTNSWSIDVVQAHLVSKGICRGYNPWIFNGELSSVKTSTEIPSSHVQENPIEYADLRDMLHDMFPIQDMASGLMEEVPSVQQPTEGPAKGPNEDALMFMKLLEDANQPCYEGCKYFSKLSAIVQLYHMKCLNCWTNKSFTIFLQFLLDFLPSNAKLPKDYYETKKIIKDLGLSYEKIHACPKDFVLYWKENANLEACPNCNISKWESNESKGQQSTNASSKKRKKKAAKILRWFPLKPRLQRLFMSPKTANHMKWHANGRVNDGLMRHPVDSEAWKSFDSKYVEFSSEPRNVRLGLAADEFNPYGNMSTTHSTWPVILIPYNLPLWMCMKRSYFMLSLLIPSPTSPGNDIDVFLQPLVEELKELDVGVETFDVSFKKIISNACCIIVDHK